jgi:hypothetical protein
MERIRTVTVVLAGLIAAVALAWAFDSGPGGTQRTITLSRLVSPASVLRQDECASAFAMYRGAISL